MYKSRGLRPGLSLSCDLSSWRCLWVCCKRNQVIWLKLYTGVVFSLMGIYIYTPYISFVVSRRISHSNMSVYSHKMALISHICFSFSWLWDRIFLQMTKKTPSPYNGKIFRLTWTALNETSIVECTFWSELCIWFCHGWNNERNLICPTWRPETNLFLSINWTEFLAISFFTVFVLKQILKEGWLWC